MSVQITGLRELISNLTDKQEDVLKAAKRANLAGGKVIVDELRRNVPRSGYSGGNPQPTLYDSIVMSNNRTDRATGESYVAVGFTKAANFRAHIPEFGSISQAPKGYMTKTAQSTESEIVKEMENAIRGAIR
ncbi:HK97 gp10 family phage protein [Virgibacillus sp. AGTR]|uniref:HK97-gp10 family putative phage morphogenesis protein n=1 Tax=Virgibacillus sp. AGTR TaxID=2812055 RepID=UPI001D15FC7E|nr:HK97-gp10 family putative phage morphogenesis protein [Virgibacillus sp. AGTR]MCC2248856.1 HK97 gp10 family phage protein [Virgibacillus sp. AGTR]